MENLLALIVIALKGLNKMREVQINLDGDAFLKREAAIEYFNQLKQNMYPNKHQNNCPRAADEKEKEAILKSLDMNPTQIYCRKRMYLSLSKAQKCINRLDADGFLDNITVARGLALGHEAASRFLDLYEDRYRDIFYNAGLKQARLAADAGDVNRTYYCMDQVEKVSYIPTFERMKLERIARENARESEIKTKAIGQRDESKIETKVIEPKKERGLHTLLTFPFKIAPAK